MSVYQNINGILTRMDASDLVQLAATDTENILGGGAGATTDGQTLVDQLAADDVQIKTDLSDYHVVPSKNYLNVTGKSRDIITVNSDNSITFNGSTTGVAKAFSFVNDSQLSSLRGTYVFSAGVNVGSNIWLTLTTNNGGIDLHDAESVTVTLTDSVYLTGEVHSYMSDGVTFSNFTVYPMLCTAADYAADPSYEPYWVCMRDGMFPRSEQAVLGAKNLCNWESGTPQNTGVTVTINADKSITLNGTSTSAGSVIGVGTFDLPAGTYKLSGCKGGASDGTTYFLDIYETQWTNRVVCTDDAVTFTFTTGGTHYIRIWVQQVGLTFTNKVIKPMITLVSDTQSDYENYAPYAMTNRELTEVKTYTLTATNTSSNATAVSCTITQRGTAAVLSLVFKTTTTVNTGSNISFSVSGVHPAPLDGGIVAGYAGSVGFIGTFGSSGNINFRPIGTSIGSDITIAVSSTYITK